MSFLRVLDNLFRFNRTNWKVVSLCFLAATVFWFFNALNKNYATNIRFPLRFEFDESKFVASKPLPRDVYVNVSGKGWELLRKTLGLKSTTLTIPLERPTEVKKIVGSTLPAVLSSQLGNLKINHIVTDTIHVSIEPRDSLMMKVIVDPGLISFKKGYGRTSPIVVLPDSIQFQGPASLIHKLAGPIVILLSQKRISDNFREPLEIKLQNDEFILHHPKSVEIMFEVGEIVEIEQKLKLSPINVPEGSRVNLGSDSITCRLQIPRNRVDDFQQAVPGVKAMVDLSDARSGPRKSLPSILGLPPYATVLGADSIRLRLY